MKDLINNLQDNAPTLEKFLVIKEQIMEVADWASGVQLTSNIRAHVADTLASLYSLHDSLREEIKESLCLN